jgi:hypothetical protein
MLYNTWVGFAATNIAGNPPSNIYFHVITRTNINPNNSNLSGSAYMDALYLDSALYDVDIPCTSLLSDGTTRAVKLRITGTSSDPIITITLATGNAYPNNITTVIIKSILGGYIASKAL